VAVRLVKRRAADPFALEQRADLAQGRFIRNLAQDQMGMLASTGECSFGSPRSGRARFERLVVGREDRDA
jgi:hypothetical protein